MNNPLILIDPTGLYEFGASLQEDKTKSAAENARRKDLRDKFTAALNRAKANLKTLEDRYGKDSNQYKETKRGVDAYGNLNDKGTIVDVGVPQQNADAEVLATKDANGNARVLFSEGAINKSERYFQSLIAHEGIHLDDVVTGNRSKITPYEREFSGNFVQSLFGEAEYTNPVLGDNGNQFRLTGFGGGVLFDPAWGSSTRPIRIMTDPSSTLDIRVNPNEELRRQAVDNVVRNGYGIRK